MLNPAHILEIALLLLVAFLCGAVVGSLARLAVSRLMPAKAVASSPVEVRPVVSDAPAAGDAPALVAAPVIGEVAKIPTPTAPADVPAPDFTEALLALAGDKPGSLAGKVRMPSLAPLPTVAVTKPAGEMRPARVAGETTSGHVVAHPRTATEPARPARVEGASAEVIPFPLQKVAAESIEPQVVVAVATPQSEPAAPIVALQQDAAPAPVVETEVVVVSDVTTPSEAEVQPEPPAPAEDVVVTLAEEAPIDAEVVADVPVVEAPVEDTPPSAVEIIAQPDVMPPQPRQDTELAAAASSAEDDEAAAMRAIEGNWSPRRAASPRARRVALPEVVAEADAVAVAAEPEEAPGKPKGIPAPRLGVKDDLTHVIGILPIIETALNNLGLYHFDQIAELSDENAGWIENHLGIAGRIGREHWREQARELALATADTRKAAGQQ